MTKTQLDVVYFPYKLYRPDGWPLCPVCLEDELHSFLYWDYGITPEPPPMLDWIAEGMGCYRCNWQYWPNLEGV